MDGRTDKWGHREVRRSCGHVPHMHHACSLTSSDTAMLITGAWRFSEPLPPQPVRLTFADHLPSARKPMEQTCALIWPMAASPSSCEVHESHISLKECIGPTCITCENTVAYKEGASRKCTGCRDTGQWYPPSSHAHDQQATQVALPTLP